MDPKESSVLAGLVEAGCQTPPTLSRASSTSASDVHVDGDGGIEGFEVDPDEMEQVRAVERQLLSVVESQQRLSAVAVSKTTKDEPSEPLILPIHKPHAYPCAETHKRMPPHPSKWPQGHVMLRPTPNTDTRVRGIRYAHDKEYQHFKGFCAGCILPINTGAEIDGESLVIDFESQHFVGTLLIRIKEAPPPPHQQEEGSSQQSNSYFDGKKRRFQAVVKGKFKTPLKMSECVTGQIFDRPAGNLPARWIVTTFIKFISTLAPQLEATIDGDQPRFLTPLVATAQTVMGRTGKENSNEQADRSNTVSKDNPITEEEVSKEDADKLYNYRVYSGAFDIEAPVEEPPAASMESMMHRLGEFTAADATTMKSVTSRQKTRKRAFNQNFANKADEPTFDVEEEYTFEFYQHLLLFGKESGLAVDCGRAIGKVQLAPITNGQPIKFMSAHKPTDERGGLNYLWSFDIWHETLYPYAQAAEE